MARRKAVILRLSQAEIEQLAIYVAWAEESGQYYGPKKQFERKHASIKNEVDFAVAWYDIAFDAEYENDPE